MILEFDVFRVDAARRQLIDTRSGEVLALTPKVFDTLLHLVERAGQLVEKDELLQAVWPTVVVEENSLERCVSTLRRTLGEKAGENRFILTVPGRGYRFVAPVREITVDAGPPPPAAKPAVKFPRRMQFAAAVVVMLLLVAGSAWWPGWTDRAVVAADPPDASAAPEASVAVMPFANSSGDPSLDYVADGIAEELIQSLAGIEGLKVPSRMSSFAYRGRNVDARRIGRELGVRHLVDGSLRRTDENTLRLSAELIDTQSGYSVWTRNYERPVGNSYDLQFELASVIVQALKPGLHAGSPGGLERTPPTSHPEAYRLLLQANAIQGAGEHNMRKALALYSEALALDPGFARALSARAVTRVLLWRMAGADTSEIALAETDAERAVALDPDYAGAQFALSKVHVARARWLEAQRALDKALEISPDDPALLVGRVQLLGTVGQWQEALRTANKAYEEAPLALPAIMTRGTMYSMVGQDGPAMKDIDLGVSLGAPTATGSVPVVRGAAAARIGNNQEAARYLLPRFAGVHRTQGVEPALELAYAAWSRPESRDQAAQALRELVVRLRANGELEVTAIPSLMVLLSKAGDIDLVYELVDGLIDTLERRGTVGIDWPALWAPESREFRLDPRFDAVVQRLGLIPYWQQYGPPDGCELNDGRLVCS